MIKKIGWGFMECNQKCDHCYSASSRVCIYQHPMDNLKSIADKICPQITDINIGTGEGVVNLNVIPILKYIRRAYPQIKLAITTNGTVAMMDEEDIAFLFHDIDVSLDFPNPGKHEAGRHHPFAWDWAIQTLRICEKIGVEKSITTCVTDNLSNAEILDFLSLAKKYNANWRVNWYRQTGRAGKNLQLSPKRFWEIIRFLLNQGIEFESLSDPLLASILGVPEQNPVCGCACGTLSCRIQPDFTVTPCVFLSGQKWSGGSILEKNLDEIYDSEIFQQLRNRLPAYCRKCELKDTCRGGCASRAFLHSGGLDKPDDCCPYAAGIDIFKIFNARDAAISNNQLKKSNISDKVHAGYLCTMIIKI